MEDDVRKAGRVLLNKGNRNCGTQCPQTLAHSVLILPQILQLSEFDPLLREIAPGHLSTSSAPGIIGPFRGIVTILMEIWEHLLLSFLLYLWLLLLFFLKRLKVFHWGSGVVAQW